MKLKLAISSLAVFFGTMTFASGLDDYYGIRFGDNLDKEFERVNAKLEHFWKIPVYPAFRLKSAHRHGDFQPRGVAVSENGHKVIAVFARTKDNELDNLDAVAEKLSSQYTQKFGSSPCVQRYGKRDKCFDRLLTWSFENPATGLTSYLVIGVPSMQFVADTGSTRITMVLSTDFDVATHHQMISTWVLHDERVMHDALVALATGKVRVNSDEDHVDVDKYIKEAKAGDSDAAYVVACYYLKGNRDVPLALKWMKSAASQGHVKAQNAMGLFYSTGHGVPKNPKLSFEWYLKAAKQGDGDSQMSVGCCYEEGDGVEKNLKESYSWFLRGAKNNHPGCQWAAAMCLAKGTGVAADLDEAIVWLRKSANAGYASAEYDLAACYIQGVGVRKNFAEGEKWLKRAAEHGDEKAQKVVEDMKKQKNH